MNQFVKQCEQCSDYNKTVENAIKEFGFCNQEKTNDFFNIKDLTFFPAERDVYQDGSVSEAPDRYYCQPCQDSWGEASEGYSYEEYYASIERPVRSEIKIDGKWRDKNE